MSDSIAVSSMETATLKDLKTPFFLFQGLLAKDEHADIFELTDDGNIKGLRKFEFIGRLEALEELDAIRTTYRTLTPTVRFAVDLAKETGAFENQTQLFWDVANSTDLSSSARSKLRVLATMTNEFDTRWGDWIRLELGAASDQAAIEAAREDVGGKFTAIGSDDNLHLTGRAGQVILPIGQEAFAALV